MNITNWLRILFTPYPVYDKIDKTKHKAISKKVQVRRKKNKQVRKTRRK